MASHYVHAPLISFSEGGMGGGSTPLRKIPSNYYIFLEPFLYFFTLLLTHSLAWKAFSGGWVGGSLPVLVGKSGRGTLNTNTKRLVVP